MEEILEDTGKKVLNPDSSVLECGSKQEKTLFMFLIFISMEVIEAYQAKQPCNEKMIIFQIFLLYYKEFSFFDWMLNKENIYPPKKQGIIYAIPTGKNNGVYLPSDIAFENHKSLQLLTKEAR